MPKKTRKKQILLRALGLLLALVLLTALTLTLIPLTERVSEEPLPGAGDWMSRLKDGLCLNEIVLPGTHDSAAQYVQLAFFSKCQALSVRQQLEAGFRYLDIRLAVAGRDMKLMHGFASCKERPELWTDPLYFSRVLEDCVSFLLAHPSETVVLAVKQEHGEESADQFAEVLMGLLEQHRENVLLTDTIPTLAQARGKLVLFRRYESSAWPQGLSFLWPDQRGCADPSLHTEMTDNGVYRLWVQDRFEYGTEDKWTAFLAGLRSSEIAPEDLSIHFLSTKGTFTYGHPYSYAKALNPRLLELDAGELRGWILVDFGDPALAEHIWSANFQSGAPALDE